MLVVEPMASPAEQDSVLDGGGSVPCGVDVRRVGAQWLDRMGWSTDRAMAVRDRWSAADDQARVTDIAYADAGRNYEIDNRACPFVIAPRPVEIELTYAKRMGEPDPAFVLTPENLLVDDMDAQAVLDELTLPALKDLTLQRLPGEKVGEYEYDPTALNAENYTLTFIHPFEITR